MDLKSDKTWSTVAGILGAVGLYLWWDGRSTMLMSAIESIQHAVGGTKYDRARQLAPYVERYRGAVPFGVCMAIAEHESGFNPAAVNASSGAAGVWQVVPQYLSDYGVTSQTVAYREGGADLDTVLDRSTAGALSKANYAHRLLEQYAPHLCPARAGCITDTYAGAIYYRHTEGSGSLGQALASAAQAAGGVTLDGILSARKMYNRPGGIRQTAALAPWWEEHAGEFLA